MSYKITNYQVQILKDCSYRFEILLDISLDLAEMAQLEGRLAMSLQSLWQQLPVIPSRTKVTRGKISPAEAELYITCAFRRDIGSVWDFFELLKRALSPLGTTKLVTVTMPISPVDLAQPQKTFIESLDEFLKKYWKHLLIGSLGLLILIALIKAAKKE